jgi:hypothetical protein
MTKNDIEQIRRIVSEAVREALTVEWTIEKHRDEQTGQPLAVPHVRTERVFLPSVIAQMLPYHEGALRGLQQDIGKAGLDVHGENLQALVQLVEQSRPVLKKLAWFVGMVERQQQQLIDRSKAENESDG